MKSVTAVCASSVSAAVAQGRVHRQRRDIENEEIQMYLSKLKELVPCIPKNRRLSKLEVIQHVIDYIGDLQFALETHPSVVAAAAAANSAITTGGTTTATTPTTVAAAAAAVAVATSVANRNVSANNATGGANTSPRQPLGVLAPNTIPNTSCGTQDMTTPNAEKVNSADSRPVSC